MAVSASGIGAGTLPIAESIKDFGLQWAEREEEDIQCPRITIRPARAADRIVRQVVRYLLSRRMPKALWGLCLATALLPAQAQEVYYIHTDALGSPVAETDANRNVVARFEYEPYGRRLNGGNDDKPGYTGHVMDAVTGLVQMQQRYYDPGIGRFLSVDPVTADGATGNNFNRYWYANNNPYTNVDPDGRICDSPSANSACNGGVVAMPSAQELRPAGEVILDFTPIVGDAKGIAEAVQDPSVVNVAAAVVGLVPVVGDAGARLIKGVDNVADVAKSAPDFVVSPGGTAFPVPAGATGPSPVINPSGKETGAQFTGGSGGANGQVSTMRIMNPNSRNPNGYVKYENSATPKPQGVDP